MAAERG